MAVVLVGFAEAYAAIEAAWSLQDAGFDVVAFAREGTKPALRWCRGIEVHRVTRPERDASAAVADVQALVQSIRPAAVLPLDDHAVWVCSRLESQGVPVASPGHPGAAYALDKQAQVDLATVSGLLVPPTQVVREFEEIRPVSWPVVVKPARALYESDGRLVRPTGVVCADDAELARASVMPWCPPLLVQPLLRGTGEGLFGHASPDGIHAWSAHRRVRMVNPQGSASSACVAIPVDPGLVEGAERFLGKLAWRGLFMLEFLRDTVGRPWFMELNGRAWGSMSLARRRGFEYPAWTVAAALDPSFVPPEPASPPPVLCRHLGMELAHLAFVVRGPRSSAIEGWPGTWSTIRDLARISRSDRLYNWRRSEPHVLLADTWQTLRTYGRRLGRGAA